jgi:hypothetical protein
MLRKSSFIAPIICVSLFLVPPIITLLLIVRQISGSPESFGEPSVSLPMLQRETYQKQPAGR